MFTHRSTYWKKSVVWILLAAILFSESYGFSCEEFQVPPSFKRFTEFDSLKELISYYKNSGVEGSDEEILKISASDWRQYCREQYYEQVRKINIRESNYNYWNSLRLERDIVDGFQSSKAVVGDIEFEIIGFVHGAKGGPSYYKEIIGKKLSDIASKGSTIFHETGLNRFIPGYSQSLRDRLAFSRKDNFILALISPLAFLYQRFLMPKEESKLSKSNDLGLDNHYDPRSHFIDRSVSLTMRNGGYYPLPIKLSVELSMKYLEDSNSLGDRLTLGRSLFMAGYALGYARRIFETNVSLVVGEGHEGQIKHTLMNPRFQENEYFQKGLKAVFMSQAELDQMQTSARRIFIGVIGPYIVVLIIGGATVIIKIISMVF